MRDWLRVLVILLCASPAAAGPILNGSFEAGLSEWDIMIPTGTAHWHPGVAYPAGTVTLRDVFSEWGPVRLPTDGQTMAFIGSQPAGGSMIVNGVAGGPWDIEIRQAITVDANMLLSGLAFFYNGDYLPQEHAWVRILDVSGAVIATPWSEWSGEAQYAAPGKIPTTPYQEASPWTVWSWQSPVAGQFIVSLGVTTGSDNQFASYAGYDAVRVQEPAGWLLCGLGFLGVLCVRMKRGPGRIRIR